MKASARQLAAAYVASAAEAEGKDVAKSAKAFVAMLKERGELHRSREVVLEIEAAWKERFGVSNVTVETAHALSKEARKALEKAAAGATIVETVDPELIAGARIRIDDRVIDATASGHLERLKAQLSA